MKLGVVLNTQLYDPKPGCLPEGFLISQPRKIGAKDVKLRKHTHQSALLPFLFIATLIACGDTETSTGETPASDPTDQGSGQATADDDGDEVEHFRPDGWTTPSHSKGVEADYAKIYPDDSVQRLDVVIDAETYAAMQENMTELYGSSNAGGGPGGGGPGGGMPDEEPSFFPVEIRYDGLTWWHVGMRYKGNSTLMSAWRRGIKKMPFRLDFDEFEDAYPEIDDQRFYGFKKITFSNGFKDDSLIREKLGGEIFRNAGVKVARSAFYRVYLDIGDGNGPTYAGLYTMVEDLSNKFLDSQFKDDSGNLYKPDGQAATWSTFSEEDFIKKTNEEESDWSDIQAAIDALHSATDDQERWRDSLEAHFNVRAYLKLLAVNQTMQNWDTYGAMTHNYYLYGDPDDNGRLLWIPWDLNECLLSVRGGPAGSGGFPGGSIHLDEVGNDWPVIRYLLDDPVYQALYYQELEALLDGAFAIDALHTRIDELHALIAPYVVGNDGEVYPYTNLGNSDAFEASIETGESALKPHVTSRKTTVEDALMSVGLR